MAMIINIIWSQSIIKHSSFLPNDNITVLVNCNSAVDARANAAAATAANKQAAGKRLPQTGNASEASMLALLGITLTGALALLGLDRKKRY